MRSPLTYFRADGSMMEMALIRVLQDRQLGAAVGFTETSRYLTSRKQTLDDAVLREIEEQTNRNQT